MGLKKSLLPLGFSSRDCTGDQKPGESREACWNRRTQAPSYSYDLLGSPMVQAIYGWLVCNWVLSQKAPITPRGDRGPLAAPWEGYGNYPPPNYRAANDFHIWSPQPIPTTSGFRKDCSKDWLGAIAPSLRLIGSKYPCGSKRCLLWA